MEHRMMGVRGLFGQLRRAVSHRGPVAWAAVVAVALLLLHAPVEATTVTSTYKCGSRDAGTVSVTYDDAVQVYAGPIHCAAGHYTISGGMNTSATATAKPPFCSGCLAWMQAVTTADIGGEAQDKNGGALNVPWPDTPPGGYLWTKSICGSPIVPPSPDPFDNEPWYGNNTVGQLTLFDQPKNGIDVAAGECDIDFESWLVCFTGKTGNTYDVIPLMGFTWGFDFTYTTDQNGNGIIGDIVAEYVGDTWMGPLTQGGFPSNDFMTGYAKYFSVTYWANNDENCKKCIPEPVTMLGLIMGVGGLMAYIRRRAA